MLQSIAAVYEDIADLQISRFSVDQTSSGTEICKPIHVTPSALAAPLMIECIADGHYRLCDGQDYFD